MEVLTDEQKTLLPKSPGVNKLERDMGSIEAYALPDGRVLIMDPDGELDGIYDSLDEYYDRLTEIGIAYWEANSRGRSIFHEILEGVTSFPDAHDILNDLFALIGEEPTPAERAFEPSGVRAIGKKLPRSFRDYDPRLTRSVCFFITEAVRRAVEGKVVLIDPTGKDLALDVKSGRHSNSPAGAVLESLDEGRAPRLFDIFRVFVYEFRRIQNES